MKFTTKRIIDKRVLEDQDFLFAYHTFCMQLTQVLQQKKSMLAILEELFVRSKQFFEIENAQIWRFLPKQELFFNFSDQKITPNDWKNSQEIWEKNKRIWLFNPKERWQDAHFFCSLVSVPLQEKSMLLVLFQKKGFYKKKQLYFFEFLAQIIDLVLNKTKENEKNLQKLAHLDAFFDSGSYLMWSVDEEWEIVRYNKAFLRRYQHLFIENENMSYQTIFKAMNKREQRSWKFYYDEAFDGSAQNFETVIRFGEEKISVEVSLSPVLYDGQIKEVSAMVQDISIKKEALELVKNSERKFRNVFESFQDVYFQINRYDVICMVTPSVEKLTGYPVEHYLYKSIWNFATKQQVTPILQQLVRKNEIRNYESVIVDTEGKQKTIISNFNVINDERGQPIFIECISRDITELKETHAQLRAAKEFAEQSLEVKQKFLSNMSHEIRTPMNGIIGMIDILSYSELNKEQKFYVDAIKSSSEVLLNIVNDVLDFSKIEADKMKLRIETVAIKELIKKVRNNFLQSAASKDLSIHYQIDEKVPPFLALDETRLVQILYNLCSNAIKFTEKGSISIFLDKLSEENFYKIQVIDTGLGISEEDKLLLFQKFSQLDNSYTKKYSGTGLGLSICKELVKLMGGEIDVISQVGIGSNFWFTFEAKTVDASTVKTDSISEEHFIFENSPFILVVDDNAVNLQVAQSILQKAKCKVVIAQSGSLAIDFVQKNDFDLIFMDIQMPIMDGIMTTKKIRSLSKKIPPIIALTAYTSESEKAHFLREGIDDCLNKPLRINALLNMILKWTTPQQFEPMPTKQSLEQTPIIDTAVTKQFLQYGGIDSIYTDYETETYAIIQNCEQALSTKNYTQLKYGVHALKGTSGTLGIEQVAKLAILIDEKLKKEDYQIEQDFENLKIAFQNYQKNYIQILQSLNG